MHPDIERVKNLAIAALEDMKAQDITVLNVTLLTAITDTMIICCGTSKRHVKSLSENVVSKAKENNLHVIGVEGEESAEWILVDLGTTLVHIMLPSIREFYNLEKLWTNIEAPAENQRA